MVRIGAASPMLGGMTSPTESYFAELDRQGRMPALARANGTIRFDLTGGPAQPWYVDIDRGDVTVSHADAEADCVVRMDRGLLDLLVEGRLNPMAALLRGDLTIEGDAQLLVLAQRMFPMPAPETAEERTS
jgi:putative sterol carrier protein